MISRIVTLSIITYGARCTVTNASVFLEHGDKIDKWPIGSDWYSQKMVQIHQQETIAYASYLHILPGGTRPSPQDGKMLASVTEWAHEVMNRPDIRNLLIGANSLRSRLDIMNRFSSTHVLGDRHVVEVFYPFSGFDLPTALAFFPDSPRVTMIAGLSHGDPICFLIPECRANLALVTAKMLQHWARHGYAWTETYIMERILHNMNCCENRTFSRSPSLQPGVIGLLVISAAFMGHTLRELGILPGGHLRIVTDRTTIDYFSRALAIDVNVQANQLQHLSVHVFSGKRVATLLKAAGAGGGYIWFPTRPTFSRWVLNLSHIVVQDETGLSPAAFDRTAIGPQFNVTNGDIRAWNVRTFGNLSELEFGHYPCLQIVPHWRPGQRLSVFGKSLNVSGEDVTSIGIAMNRAYASTSKLPFRWGYATAGESCLRRMGSRRSRPGGGVLLSAWR